MAKQQSTILGSYQMVQLRQSKKTLTEKIRHQIHHPENCHNEPYTETEIRQSIEDMRAFIMRK